MPKREEENEGEAGLGEGVRVFAHTYAGVCVCSVCDVIES